jgi:hypothetical protein
MQLQVLTATLALFQRWSAWCSFARSSLTCEQDKLQITNPSHKLQRDHWT